MKAAERFDADYFQPKYDEIIAAVKACPGGWDALGNLVSARKCIEVGSREYLDEGVPFVRVSDLGPFEIAREKRISESLYSSIKEHQPQQGEILFSKDATPGIAHYLNEKPERMIPSGGILRLKSKTDKVNNEYLTLALNSILTKEQINRDVGGSVILHWRPEQVKRTAIPLLPEELQAETGEWWSNPPACGRSPGGCSNAPGARWRSPSRKTSGRRSHGWRGKPGRFGRDGALIIVGTTPCGCPMFPPAGLFREGVVVETVRRTTTGGCPYGETGRFVIFGEFKQNQANSRAFEERWRKTGEASRERVFTLQAVYSVSFTAR